MIYKVVEGLNWRGTKTMVRTNKRNSIYVQRQEHILNSMIFLRGLRSFKSADQSLIELLKRRTACKGDGLDSNK